MTIIPFHKTYRTGRELEYIRDAIDQGSLVGDGAWTKKCREWLERTLDAHSVLLTTSCTTALEMAALLCKEDREDPGEVIIPGFTFVSTANAFVLHGYKPVFVDIKDDDCNVNPERIRAAITPRTRVIVPVHYAGVPCDMDAIMAIAKEHDLLVVEDAAQAFLSTYKGRQAATIGHFGAFSFHDTKNVGCGEGGALVINDDRFMARAEYIREKGTNRTSFIRGEVDKYTWVDIGGSYLPSELQAAFLYAQLETAREVNAMRREVYEKLILELAPLEASGDLQLPRIPTVCGSNYHLLHILLDSEISRNALLAFLKSEGIGTAFHYVPLHLSPGGRKYSAGSSALPVVESVSGRLLRLPLYPTLTDAEIERIGAAVSAFFAGGRRLSKAGM